MVSLRLSPERLRSLCCIVTLTCARDGRVATNSRRTGTEEQKLIAGFLTKSSYSGCRLKPASPPDIQSLSSLGLDPAHQGVVLHRGELDHILATGIGIHRELLDDGFVLGSGSREDIEVAQHLGAVDAYVEDSRAGSGP